MSNIETNSGMIANAPEMRNFVQYLNQLARDLTDKMNAAKAQVENMHKLGYSDDTFVAFRQKFIEEVKFINQMNEYLKKNSQHYTRQAEIVEKHLGNKIK